jgi:hypothetical protein
VPPLLSCKGLQHFFSEKRNDKKHAKKERWWVVKSAAMRDRRKINITSKRIAYDTMVLTKFQKKCIKKNN